MLPRGSQNGQVLGLIYKTIGVQGGFVVCGRLGNDFVAVHYDFRQRTVRAYPMVRDGALTGLTAKWYWFANFNAVIVNFGAGYIGLDLVTGTIEVAPEFSAKSNQNARLACLKARACRSSATVDSHAHVKSLI